MLRSSASADTTAPDFWSSGQTTECISDGPEVRELSVSQGEITVVSLLEAGDDCKQVVLLLFRETKQLHLLFANDFILLFKASPCWTLTYQLKQKLNCVVLLLSV